MKLSSTKRYWLAASCITRENEFWSKVNRNSTFFNSYWDSLTKYQKDDEHWPVFDINSVINIAEERITEIDSITAKIALGLISIKKPDDYPDFAGQFLHSLGEAIFNSILKNDSDKFFKLFHSYFNTTFIQAQKLMPTNVKEEWLIQSHTKIAFAPIIDLIDLTGYCILMSEYYENNQLKNVVEFYWNQWGKSETALKKIEEFKLQPYIYA